MRMNFQITAVCILSLACTTIYAQHGRLQVNPKDRHTFIYDDGTPFFWMADTGWELIHALNRSEVTDYFNVRKEQGFNVVQAVLISEFDGLTRPNAYGEIPLIDRNPDHLSLKLKSEKNRYDYWDHVDYVVEEAARLGFVMALLPCWGEYVVPREGRQIFKTNEQAYNYGIFLGKRYARNKNIVWILGGDRLPDETPTSMELWKAMANGLVDGTNASSKKNETKDFNTTLITYHCSESSSKWFQHEPWLDFNMWGSYHDNFSNTKAFEQVYTDYALDPIKPTINGEPAYELHPVNWIEGNGEFTAYDVRQIAYWSVIAGAAGHTYGCNPVWQFYDTLRPLKFFAHLPWKQTLHAEGANQLIHLKNLMMSRPLNGKVPANSIVVNKEKQSIDQYVASKGDGFLFVYLPTGHPVTINPSLLLFTKFKAWWYNPRDGQAKLIGDYEGPENRTFSPPGMSNDLKWLKTGRGCDWVLVVDDASKSFQQPGR